LALNCTKKWIQ